MYSDIIRTDEYKHRLLSFIKSEYGIDSATITPAKRGFYGETWRLESADTRYFVKIVYATEHQDIYKRSFPVIRHLCDHGIGFISRIIKTKDGNFSKQFDSAILGVFDWIDGELIETDATKIPEYQMLAKIYTVPVHGVSIHCEDFSARSTDRVFEQWCALKDKKVISLLEKSRSKIEHRAKRLKLFAERCKDDTTNFFITHGDAGGNLIVNGDNYFIVDWDYALLAPPERDAWVMCCKNWAMDAFHEALRHNGIQHTLRPERLAYYCYNYFFFYLAAFLDASSNADTIEQYINGWIEESFRFADGIP